MQVANMDSDYKAGFALGRKPFGALQVFVQGPNMAGNVYQDMGQPAKQCGRHPYPRLFLQGSVSCCRLVGSKLALQQIKETSWLWRCHCSHSFLQACQAQKISLHEGLHFSLVSSMSPLPLDTQCIFGNPWLKARPTCVLGLHI